MVAFLNWALATKSGCYVTGSFLLTLMVMLSMWSRGRLQGRNWMVVVTCLPVVNIIILAYLVLDATTLITGNPIVIGRRRG
ncbi:hypothetical protein [Burkholderia phage FLC9]|nr:hypothetical protein [Burkholderia phage FLC9]